VIRPALDDGADVVCDRYVDSSLAYQGVARGLGVERVLALNLAATGGLLPDRTFVLLLDVEQAAARAGDDPDRIEREGAGFRAALDRGYRSLVERFPDRIVPVEASRRPAQIAKIVRHELRERS
jgi:dTMP kinase